MADFMLERRSRMVDEQLVTRGITDQRVLRAMRSVPRHEFVPEELRYNAYEDNAMPIGEGQTISQPYMVALMTSLLSLSEKDRVLEIGTGSGYQAAVLAELCGKVFSVERIKALADRARTVLDRLGYRSVAIKVFDGTYGWKDMSPFDGIIVTAAAPEIPQPLVDQLAIGGRMVVPVGERFSQVLVRIHRTEEGLIKSTHVPCVFVPLIGNHGWKQ